MLEKQILISIFLNSITVLFCVICVSSEFLSFSSFKITLHGIINNVGYEDVHGEVYASFASFESFACRKSRNEGILTVCGNILNFETSGIIMQISSGLAVVFNVFSIYTYMVHKKYAISHFIALGVYVFGSLAYFALNSKELLDPQDESVALTYESGCFLIFLTNVCQLITTMHVVYASKSQNLQYQPFSEVAVMSENVKNQKNIEKYEKEISQLELAKQELLRKLGNGDGEVWKALKELKLYLEKIGENPSGSMSEIKENVSLLFDKVDCLAEKKWEKERKKYDLEIQNLLGEVETTKRYSGMDDDKVKQEVLKLHGENQNLIGKIEKLAKENGEVKSDLSKIVLQAELRLEETERQRRILENNKQIMVENQIKIEELEKNKKTLESKEKNSAENMAELKKYLKDYEDLLLQLKRDKDDVTRALKTKESDLENLESQFSTIKAESASLKSMLNSDSMPKSSLSDIEISTLTSQLAISSENLKKSKQELQTLQENYSEQLLTNKKLDSKLENSLKEYQNSLSKIYELENTIKDISDVKVKYTKALDDINDLSTMLESFKKDFADSKISDEKSFFYEKCAKKKEKIQQLKKEIRSLNRKLERLNNSLQDSLQIEETLKITKESEQEAYKKLAASEEEFGRVKAELVHSAAQQVREVEILQNRMKTQEDFFEKELQSTQLALESIKDEYKKTQAAEELYKAEYENQKELGKALTKALPEDVKNLVNESIGRSEANIKEFKSQFEKIVAEKEKLRKKLQQTEGELQTVSEENQNLHKLRFEQRKEDTFSISSMESSRSIQDSLIIEGISPSIIFHNPLLEKISKLRKEPPMTYSAVWKLLELLMSEKGKVDKEDIQIGKNPRNVADFMFEFMNKQYGLKSLGLTQLKALINSLEELYKISHPYSIFFCRVLGIFHPRPIPNKVCAYIFALQEQFKLLVKKVKNKPESFPEVYETMQFGGECSIADLVELVKKVFKNHRSAGERILDNLHRDQPDKLELAILKICANLAASGKTDDFIFEVLKSERLDYQEFIDGVRETLDVWISQEEGEMLCELFDEEHEGTIQKSAWKAKVKFADFSEKIYCKAAMVSKADFLNSLISEYEYEALEDYHALKKLIQDNVLTPEAASKYLVEIDSSLNIDAQERIFKEALVHDGGHGKEVTCEAFCIVILKHTIGGYGKGLFQLELLQETLAS